MSGKWCGKWEGGQIWETETGEKVYRIRKMRQGVRYDLSTHTSSLAAAREHYKRFSADPAAYVSSMGPPGPSVALFMDDVLVNRFLGWSARAKAEGGRENSPGWVTNQRSHLKWWMQQLYGKDLKTLNLRLDILLPLEGSKSRSQKIAVVKAFFGWLRTEEHALLPAQDATFGTLKAVQSDPAQWKKSKAVAPADFETLISVLRNGWTVTDRLGKSYRKDRAHWSDIVCLLAGTGWHVTEAHRFSRGGECLTVNGRPVVVCPMTKGGELLRTEVSPRVFDAASRVLQHGSFSVREFYRVCEEALKRSGIPEERWFKPGNARHSVATWAVDNGEDPAAVSAFLGHKSVRTTRRFYSTLATPKKVKTLV